MPKLIHPLSGDVANVADHVAAQWREAGWLTEVEFAASEAEAANANAEDADATGADESAPGETAEDVESSAPDTTPDVEAAKPTRTRTKKENG